MQSEAIRGAPKAARGMPSHVRGVRTRDHRPLQADQGSTDHVPGVLSKTRKRRSVRSSGRGNAIDSAKFC